MQLGVDATSGGDETVLTLRSTQTAMIIGRNGSADSITIMTEVQRVLEEWPQLRPEDVFIDDINIGRGPSDWLKESRIPLNGVSVGEAPQDKSRYQNIKAEAYRNTGQWLQQGG